MVDPFATSGGDKVPDGRATTGSKELKADG